MGKILTALDVERHKFPEPDLTDLKCPGLRLVANQPLADGAQRRSWIYRYRVRAGQLKQIKLGEYPALGLAAARQAWAMQKQVRDDPTRGDPRAVLREKTAAERAAAAAARERAYTVRRMCDDYLTEHVERAYKRHEEVARMFERDVHPVLGDRAAVEVRRRDVHLLVQGIIARPAPRIAQMVKGELQRAFGHAISSGRLPDEFANPAIGVKAPPQIRRERAFHEGELQRFVRWLPTAEGLSRAVKDALMLELLTTARQGEIVAATWADMDFERGIWHQPTSKNGRPHDVMLSKQAAAILQARRQGHPTWVFPRPDKLGPIASKAVGIQQYAARDASGIQNWTTHDVRRSALTGLARLGCSRVVQDRISNHYDSSIAAIYDRHTYDAEARDWLQRWADYLDKLAVGEAGKVLYLERVA